MSRRNRAKRVLVQPDTIYGSRLVNLLVARILKSGKKSVAQKIVYNALEIITTKTEENPIREEGKVYLLSTILIQLLILQMPKHAF